MENLKPIHGLAADLADAQERIATLTRELAAANKPEGERDA